jgi:hypothetical protein
MWVTKHALVALLVAVAGGVEDAGHPLVGGEQAFEVMAKGEVRAARAVDEGPLLDRGGVLQGGGEQRLFVHGTALRG